VFKLTFDLLPTTSNCKLLCFR